MVHGNGPAPIPLQASGRRRRYMIVGQTEPEIRQAAIEWMDGWEGYGPWVGTARPAPFDSQHGFAWEADATRGDSCD